jgi:hypothetical protein
LADALLNVAMIVSVGAIVFLRWGSVVGAGLAGAAPSTAIELIQILVPGRYTTLGDVVWNAIGAVAGAGIWIFMARCSRRRPRRATLVAARSTESSGAASWPPVGSWNRAPAGPARPRPRRPDPSLGLEQDDRERLEPRCAGLDVSGDRSKSQSSHGAVVRL